MFYGKISIMICNYHKIPSYLAVCQSAIINYTGTVLKLKATNFKSEGNDWLRNVLHFSMNLPWSIIQSVGEVQFSLRYLLVA